MSPALVVVHVVDIEYIAVPKAPRHAPMTGHPNGPMAHTRCTQRMCSEAG